MSANNAVTNTAAEPPPGREKGLAGWVREAVDKGRAFLLGYDLFISYCRADANDYALRLASRLTKRGFRCYLDQYSASADAELPEDVKDALRHSAGLVIVGSPGALESKAIAEEVAIFSKLSRTILPINVAGTLKDATWDGLIAGISRTEETREALDRGRPSRQALTRLNDSVSFKRRNAQLKRVFSLTLAAIAALILAGAALILVFKQQVSAARVQAAEAEQKRLEAVGLMEEANRQRQEAEATLATTNGRLTEANAALQKAGDDLASAQKSTEQAQAQERAARARAEGQTKLAERQPRPAVSQERGAGAAEQLPTNPEAGVLLARDAYTASPTAEAENILRRSLLVSNVRSVMAADEGLVLAEAFDREGKYAATVHKGGRVKVWEARTGKLLATLTNGGAEGSDEGAQSQPERYERYVVRFSPNGEYIVTGGLHERTLLWAWRDESARNHPKVLDGRQPAFGFNVERCVVPFGSAITSVAFTNDTESSYVATAGDRGIIWVWETSSGTLYKPLAAHDGPVSEVSFSPNDKYLASAGEDARGLLWDWKWPGGGRSPRTLRTTADAAPSQTDAVAPTQDASSVSGAKIDNHRVDGIVFDGAGAQVLTFAHENFVAAQGTVLSYATVYDVETGSVRAVLKGHEREINYASFSPDGSYVVTASADGTARVWNWRDEQSSRDPVILRGHDGPVLTAEFSPDGKYVVT